MRPRGRAGLLAAVIAIGGCLSQATPVPSPSPDQPRGGTLRLGVPHDDPPPSGLASSDPDANTNALDPHHGGWYDANELHRCCLSRTLVSYVGRPTAEGGAILRPDLATALPEVSSDGLTWTFRIRDDVHYAPPLQDVEVTASDFVRTLLRVLPIHGAFPEGFATLTQIGIEGADAYVAGTTDTVSGIEVPDEHTLRLNLVRPAGDLPSRFALTDTAPIPPSPADPTAPLGIATGHDADYGRFFAATGPYMIEGADLTDYTVAPEAQVPAAGYVPGASLTLVRNPSWRAETDPLRPAYVDRIEIAIGADLPSLSARVDAGELDFVFSSGAPPQAPLEQVVRYGADPSLGRVHRDSRDIIRYLEMNLALPPFDDVAVRRAVSLVIDRAGLIGEGVGVPAGHLVLDSIEGELLKDYAPFGDPDGRPDVEAAREEMRRSRYDGDGDGRCDDPACGSVGMVTFFRFTPEQVASVAADLEELGITTVVVPDDPFDEVDPWRDPAHRNGLYAGGPWAKDTLDAAPFYRAIFDSRWSMSNAATNGNMIGSSAGRLAAWGYDVEEPPPTIDDRIDACSALADATSQVRCWADLDLYLMEMVVPWVPLFFEAYVRTTGPRVVHYSFDQQTALPALDQIALAP